MDIDLSIAMLYKEFYFFTDDRQANENAKDISILGENFKKAKLIICSSTRDIEYLKGAGSQTFQKILAAIKLKNENVFYLSTESFGMDKILKIANSYQLLWLFEKDCDSIIMDKNNDVSILKSPLFLKLSNDNDLKKKLWSELKRYFKL